MRPLIASLALLACFLPAAALADAAFLEGHVFNRKTGVPIAGAVVVLPDFCDFAPCGRAVRLPIRVVTDDNGFYSARYPLGFTEAVPIEVSCLTREGIVTGESQAVLRPGTIRRDVFLRVRRRLSRCLSPT